MTYLIMDFSIRKATPGLLNLLMLKLSVRPVYCQIDLTFLIEATFRPNSKPTNPCPQSDITLISELLILERPHYDSHQSTVEFVSICKG